MHASAQACHAARNVEGDTLAMLRIMGLHTFTGTDVGGLAARRHASSPFPCLQATPTPTTSQVAQGRKRVGGTEVLVSMGNRPTAGTSETQASSRCRHPSRRHRKRTWISSRDPGAQHQQGNPNYSHGVFVSCAAQADLRWRSPTAAAAPEAGAAWGGGGGPTSARNLAGNEGGCSATPAALARRHLQRRCCADKLPLLRVLP